MAGMRPVPLPEAGKLLKKLPGKYAALAAIGIATGCRISELLQLKRSDLIDAEGNLKDRIKFIVLKTRSDHAIHRQLKIPPALQGYVIRHLTDDQRRGFDRPDGYVFRGSLNRALNRRQCSRTFHQLLGPGYGTHWMRKTFAVEIYKYFLAENNPDPLYALDQTRQALNHKRLETTIKYLNIQYHKIDAAQSSIFTRENIFNAKRKEKSRRQ